MNHQPGTAVWDISLPIRPGMAMWPGDPAPSVTPAYRIAAGDGANVSRLVLSSHTGTHIDPPCHVIEGAPSVDQLPLAALMGEAVVVWVDRSSGTIDPADLEGAGLEGAERVLFKTGNSARWASGDVWPDYVALSAGAAAWLVGRGVRLVGIDALSIEAPGEVPGSGAAGLPAHRTLLEAGVVIVEGLDLSAVAPGRYQLVCLPLRIEGGDGGPARAVLLPPI
ncbi:MAG TPA: cyclase family protein [Actinomycetota bacterium]|nr:cyclase family protein [Actinomycetota bacterium]